MLIQTTTKLNVSNGHRKRLQLEPLPGCTVEVLRLYRLTTAERKELKVAKDNPGVIAVIA